MRLATILPRASVEPVAVAAAPDGKWVELAALTGRTVPRLEDALSWLFAHTAHLAGRAATWRGPRYQESEFIFQPPVARPAAVRDFDAFEAHAQACRARGGRSLPAAWYEMPVFHFANHHALVGHEASVWAPRDSQALDFGLALGVVIGRGGRNIPERSAWEHVAGLTIVNDFAARDLELRELPAGLGPAKGRDFATAVGPWLVTRDALADRIAGDRCALTMVARVNGRELTRGDAGSLYHPIPRLIAQAARDAELFPGDLLCTGPVGGGCILDLGPENTGGWLKPGDVVELEIERLGLLRTRIVARPA
ncbi:MAG TPA: fumarylacetoacetate hydrolase family protein [Opitutaceae bacterium]|nr:fumarylacetoacetate hydrolase family protein [Opitutaceae bacterium]